jgi:hypothetical protein
MNTVNYTGNIGLGSGPPIGTTVTMTPVLGVS